MFQRAGFPANHTKRRRTPGAGTTVQEHRSLVTSAELTAGPWYKVAPKRTNGGSIGPCMTRTKGN